MGQVLFKPQITSHSRQIPLFALEQASDLTKARPQPPGEDKQRQAPAGHLCTAKSLLLPRTIIRLRSQQPVDWPAATTAWTLTPDIDLKSPIIASLHPRDQHHHHYHHTSSASASFTTPPLSLSPLPLSSPIPTSVSDLAPLN
ncbi:hypothetical protein FHL15_004328 [Xylaria flabelliformis]|uniref:Uncharacterized protein n=1 Tax=Xylaria flabelliformis TaxID=2512241 RepID=A0A553I3T4_9PEZI|nr:hypothetical protein FHL15_004328 [Xylaria flabelliformis]